MAIEKVWIEDGCIGCSLCEMSAPSVFEMEDGVAVVKKDAKFNENEATIKEAANGCPVDVIFYE